jgi:outer membrane protein OmpA-like peptidoglycan-associated protein
MLNRLLLSIVCYLCVGWMQAQSPNTNPIYLENPSFEDFERAGHTPHGWFDCGKQGETPPDTQPGSFEVNVPAQNGGTYVGMVVRDNDTWEALGQRLERPLDKDQLYTFSLQLCRATLYKSLSRKENETVNYERAVKIRLWGGNTYCGKVEMLAETGLVSNTQWQEYKFRFTPKYEHSFFMIEAFYQTPILEGYNGNVLMDNASPIKPVIKDQPIADVAKPKPVVKPIPKPQPTVKPTPKPDTSGGIVAVIPPINNPIPPKQQPTTPPPIKTESKPLSELDKTKIKTGQIIPIDKVFFEADTSAITPNSFVALSELFQFLDDNKNISIEVGGHTNNIPEEAYCDKLSTDRAQAVVDYLAKRGIDRTRLKYRGYGKRNPVATNSTVEGRRRNQRVEIKILSVN